MTARHGTHQPPPRLDKCTRVTALATRAHQPPPLPLPEDGKYQGTHVLPCLFFLDTLEKPWAKRWPECALTYPARSALLSPSNRSFCRTQPWTAARTPQGPPCRERHASVPVRTNPRQSCVSSSLSLCPQVTEHGAPPTLASETGVSDAVTTSARCSPSATEQVTEGLVPITRKWSESIMPDGRKVAGRREVRDTTVGFQSSREMCPCP